MDSSCGLVSEHELKRLDIDASSFVENFFMLLRGVCFVWEGVVADGVEASNFRAVEEIFTLDKKKK